MAGSLSVDGYLAAVLTQAQEQLRHRRHLFEPFYATKGEGGTGLGLWLSQGIIHKDGGDIRVRSGVHPDHRGDGASIFLRGQSQDQAARAA